MVSPYTQAHYVSGACSGGTCQNDQFPYQHDFGSILAFPKSTSTCRLLTDPQTTSTQTTMRQTGARRGTTHRCRTFSAAPPTISPTSPRLSRTPVSRTSGAARARRTCRVDRTVATGTERARADAQRPPPEIGSLAAAILQNGGIVPGSGGIPAADSHLARFAGKGSAP